MTMHSRVRTPAAAGESSEDLAQAWRRANNSHPLEIIPFFRRYPCGFWRDLVYTFIWNVLIGGFFTVLAFLFGGFSLQMLYANMVLANCIGYTIHFLFFLAAHTIEPWVERRNKVWITLYYSGIPMLGVLIGFVIAAPILHLDIGKWFLTPNFLAGVVTISLIVSLILTTIFFWRERSAVAEAHLERERARTAAVEREALSADLRALQAQIEPHFLFNTLANVVSLIHPAPDKAKHMLESFIQYLRASLSASRAEATTLAREFELMQTFLGILRTRMGDRLAFRVDLPAQLEQFPVPPMLLQPLVENAIKHGLEPKIDGGEIVIGAARSAAGDTVQISVADSGMGFNGATSNGVGLRNVRERLAGLFGDAGRLSIEENQPCGTRVTITVPFAHQGN